MSFSFVTFLLYVYHFVFLLLPSFYSAFPLFRWIFSFSFHLFLLNFVPKIEVFNLKSSPLLLASLFLFPFYPHHFLSFLTTFSFTFILPFLPNNCLFLFYLFYFLSSQSITFLLPISSIKQLIFSPFFAYFFVSHFLIHIPFL